MIRYEEIEPHLVDFLQGNVAEEVEYRVKAYLQQNPDFQQELDELAETLDFTQNTPLSQPAPELKMNFYAMLNTYKAQQARPSLRERMKGFWAIQFQWQTISASIFTVLLLVVGYWSVSLYQNKYKATQVTMQKFDFENEKQDTAPLILPTPKQKEKIAKNQTENAAQGRENENNLFETDKYAKYQATIPQAETENKQKYAQDDFLERKELPTTTYSLYTFENDTQTGTVELNNPLGNINLTSYTGVEVKVESVPAQSFKAQVVKDKITVNGLAYAPQMDMQVFIPQNRSILLNVSAKQNIVADLTNMNVADNSTLTSFAGDVEVRTSEVADLQINVSGREIENDFEIPVPFMNKDRDKNAMANSYRDESVKNTSTTLKDVKTASKPKKKDVSRKARANTEKEDLLEKDAEKKADTQKNENFDIEENNAGINASPTSPDRPQTRNAKIVLKTGGKQLQINSPQGKAKIKKIR